MGKAERKAYEEALAPMQEELVGAARWAAKTGARVLVILEGRDTAGKSGVIHAILEKLNPRQCRSVALSKPSDTEKGQWYFQRYVPHLPSAGEIVLFDRSWYNRAGVEKVMGFANDDQVRAFLAQVPVFEKLLTDDGILLFKYWLTADQAEQEKRFKERLDDPLKRWKLSPVDIAARQKYADYTAAREAMLGVSHTPNAPWTLVDFNEQKEGRLTLIRNLLDRMPDTRVPLEDIELPPLAQAPGAEQFGVLKPIAPFRAD